MKYLQFTSLKYWFDQKNLIFKQALVQISNAWNFSAFFSSFHGLAINASSRPSWRCASRPTKSTWWPLYKKNLPSTIPEGRYWLVTRHSKAKLFQIPIPIRLINKFQTTLFYYFRLYFHSHSIKFILIHILWSIIPKRDPFLALFCIWYTLSSIHLFPSRCFSFAHGKFLIGF